MKFRIVGTTSVDFLLINAVKTHVIFVLLPQKRADLQLVCNDGGPLVAVYLIKYINPQPGVVMSTEKKSNSNSEERPGSYTTYGDQQKQGAEKKEQQSKGNESKQDQRSKSDRDKPKENDRSKKL